ncbi:MAG: SAM-dependent methyltransferase [Sterolibacterium sp.]|jgi:SAM-dependent MidA family methyltransferase
MCHYRHHAHGDPLWWPGLNDITAHVDFTAVAEAGFEAGLDVLGYTGQARFLLNCGITEILGRLPDQTGKAFLAQSRAVGKLISPNEMGELFKVIALGRGLKEPLLGFSRGDRLHTL